MKYAIRASFMTLAVVAVALSARPADAWWHGRVTTNYSLPSVPAVSAGYAPVVVGRPIIAASPVVVASPVNQTTVVRGFFGRPRFVINSPVGVAAPVATSAYYAPVATSTYYAPTLSSAPVSTYYAPTISSAPVSTYYATSVSSGPVSTYYAPSYSSAPVSTFYAPSATIVGPSVILP